MFHESIEQWSALQIPTFHSVFCPLSWASAPADNHEPVLDSDGCQEGEEGGKEVDKWAGRRTESEEKASRVIMCRKE